MHPPSSETELLVRTRALAGRSLADVAAMLGLALPADLRRAKGWVGELLETALGAPGGSAPEPDFAALGVELKTVPVRADGRPRESTHVCTVPLHAAEGITWETSLVRRKLARVLWIPIETPGRGTPDTRRIGNAVLWSPTAAEDAVLCTDFDELMALVAAGTPERISGEMGTWLQIRPKAAHGHALTRTYDARGRPAATLPRGFYLRAAFTARILRAACAVAG